MIEIINKEDCVGCNACVQICPKQCIAMQEDHEGFLYPTIDHSLCIDCSLCEKVCPVIHQNPIPEEKPMTYAAKSKDEEIRRQSSSGGIFTLLAEAVIREGGVVFGARFDEKWEVVHDYAETVDSVAAFRGSKYVQSRIGDNFLKVREFLKTGRKVLFSGTPCQIAGLKRFLRKEYSNLLAVDFVCHGVPSPGVWRIYKQELLNMVKKKNTVSTNFTSTFKEIRFRDKTDGWKKFSFATTIRVANQNSISLREPLNENIFMRGFLHDLYLRPSCHVCPAKSFKSGSDLTIADFWGIQNYYPEFDDDRGSSLVIVSTEKGQNFYDEVRQEQEILQVPYEIAYAGNPSIDKSVKPHVNRAQFYAQSSADNFTSLILSLTRQPILLRMKHLIYRIAKMTGVFILIKMLKFN